MQNSVHQASPVCVWSVEAPYLYTQNCLSPVGKVTSSPLFHLPPNSASLLSR